MRFWWVNQNQTFRHEVAGGYLWSPKRKANGGINPFYETMREVAPGDLVFSFADRRIAAVGISASYAYAAPKPAECGKAGFYWDRIGWRVDVRFTVLPTTFQPADWIEDLRPLLPRRYSPLLPDGRGVQSIYLTELAENFARRLAHLIGPDVERLMQAEEVHEAPPPDSPREGLAVWEEHLRDQVRTDTALTETQREALVLARRGQGLLSSAFASSSRAVA
jgi:hypothetical protein